MQIFEINQDNVAETWELIITDPSNGAFRLVFQDPDTLKFIKTKDIMHADDHAGKFKKSIAHSYYDKHVRSITSVTKTDYDANGDVTTDKTLIVTAKYRVEVLKRLPGPSFASISVLKDPANKSTITLVRPTDDGGQVGSEPLGGKFIVECPHPKNPAAILQSREFSIHSWEAGMEVDLGKDIPFLNSMIYVRKINNKSGFYVENFRKFSIEFIEFNRDMPQCSLKSSISDPITGNNVVLKSTTLHEYADSLFFEPIPSEMLFTPATKPQISVSVDGITAACANLNCDYLYAD